MFASKFARSATLTLAVAAVVSSFAAPATAGVNIFGNSEDKQQVQLPDFVKLVEDNGPGVVNIQMIRNARTVENAGIPEEKLAAFQVRFEETFGDDAALSPRNLVDSKRMQLKTPDVIIHVAPDRGDLVETRTLGGVKYILVRAEDGVELNGVDIQIDGN